MLYVDLGSPTDEMRCIDDIWEISYDLEWFSDNTVKEIIRDIDKSEVIGPDLINSPFLGMISSERISRGSKTLILMLKEPKEYKYWLTLLGDNCIEWLCKISLNEDISGVLSHVPGLFIVPDCECKISFQGIVYTDFKSFLSAFSKAYNDQYTVNDYKALYLDDDDV